MILKTSRKSFILSAWFLFGLSSLQIRVVYWSLKASFSTTRNRFRDSSQGSRVFRLKILVLGLGLHSQTSGLGSRVSGLRSPILGLRSQDSGLGTLVSGLRSWVFGVGDQDSGLRTYLKHPIIIAYAINTSAK